IVQGWYSFKDLKPYFPNPLTGVQIDGKDLVENDPVTYLYCLWELNSKDFVNEQVPFTREKLICLIPIIFSALDQNDPVTALQYMKLFVKHYPKVKQLYITSAQGSDEFSLESSWTKVLGKVYTENEFDSCLDWETELPVNLNGMYNIFKTHADHQTIEDQWKVLSVIEEEEKKTPSNPYILVFKGYFGDSAKDFIYGSKCLELLAKSPAKVELLKRTEKFNVFKNEQPSNLEIIKDFKFFPLLFWKCVVLSKQEDPRMAVELFKQVEYYSKKQTHFPLLLLKMTLEFRFANDEEVLRIFQLMEPFESQTNLVLLVSATNYACMSMKNLGLEQEIVPMLEKFIEKYGKESNFTTILNYYKKLRFCFTDSNYDQVNRDMWYEFIGIDSEQMVHSFIKRKKEKYMENCGESTLLSHWRPKRTRVFSLWYSNPDELTNEEWSATTGYPIDYFETVRRLWL
ncbi:predicted protein, partial [Naegleria gruberi]